LKTRYELPNGDVLRIYEAFGRGGYDVYQDVPPGTTIVAGIISRRVWHNVDELTMKCIVLELQKDPLARMEEINPQEVIREDQGTRT
jgi:hypothetical protein